MRVHRWKYKLGKAELLVSAAPSVLENLAKLKLGTIAKDAFAMQRLQIALDEAKLGVAGRELAYILHARQAFTRG